MICNNTDADISIFRPWLENCIKEGKESLPWEISDIFTLTIKKGSDISIGILNWL